MRGNKKKKARQLDEDYVVSPNQGFADLSPFCILFNHTRS